MLDLKKINLIRTQVTNGLLKSDSYKIYCNLTNVELIELSKQFNISTISEIKNGYKHYIFKNK
jgi:hypothetical protein